MAEESTKERVFAEFDPLKAKVKELETQMSDLTLAKAIRELAEAVNKQTASSGRVKIIIGTPGSGGEMEVRFDPNEPIADFINNELRGAIEKNEELIKAKIELNNKYGIGVKKEKGEK